jgi:List-Bact-rpt repeat protein
MSRNGPLSRLVAVVVAMGASVAGSTAVRGQVAAEIPVLTTPAGEFQPARTTDALAWERNTRARPNEYAVMVQADGSNPVQANRLDTSAAMGDFIGGRLVYQQYRGNPARRGRSGLFFFDISSGSRSKVAGVNSRQWEYWPSSSGGWLLFARWNPRTNVRRLILHNFDSGEQRVLDKIKGKKAFLGPGQVNGNYAVWYVCRPRCEVLRYDIAARTEATISNPGFYQRAPSVTSGGTVYFSRGGRRCGTSVSLVRDSLQGPQQVLVQLQTGLDIADTYAHGEPSGSTEVYYERNVCGRAAASDIYKVRETSLATLTVQVVEGQGTVISSAGGINCGSDCAEDYEVGTEVTLAALPSEGYRFDEWGGACGGEAPCLLIMDSSKEVTATFREGGDGPD